MTRSLSITLFLLALPLTGTVPVYYRHAEPELSRFYSRSHRPLGDGFRVLYDRAFRLQEVVRLDRGKPVRTWKYAYDRLGRLTGCDRHDGASGRTEGWRYDAAGRITERIVFTGQGAWNRPWRVYRISYDPSGRPTSEREMVGDKVLKTIQYTYHPGGELLSKGVYSLTGYLLERTVYRTDDAGRITEALLYRWGRLFKVHVYRYASDGSPLPPRERKPIPGDPVRDPLAEPVKPLTNPGG